MRLKKMNDGSYLFYCEGCDRAHGFNDTWHFDGNMTSPTITPSLLVTMPIGGGVNNICHSFIKNGEIQYLNDCTHELAGQTVKLKDEDEWFKDTP